MSTSTSGTSTGALSSTIAFLHVSSAFNNSADSGASLFVASSAFLNVSDALIYNNHALEVVEHHCLLLHCLSHFLTSSFALSQYLSCVRLFSSLRPLLSLDLQSLCRLLFAHTISHSIARRVGDSRLLRTQLAVFVGFRS